MDKPVIQTCPKCLQDKPLEEFRRDGTDHVKYICKKCDHGRWNQYAHKNPKMVKTLKMLKNAERRAKKYNLEFDIDLETIRSLIVDRCPVFGVELDWSVNAGNGRKEDCIYGHSPTLDRKDNSRGYIKGNVWIISHMANRLKSNATLSQLVALSRIADTTDGT